MTPILYLTESALSYVSAKVLEIKSDKAFWGTLAQFGSAIILSFGMDLVKASPPLAPLTVMIGSAWAARKITKIICGEEYTIKEIAEKIIKFTNSKSSISYKPLPKDDPKKRCPDISRAKSILKWEPKIPFEQGLQKSIEYFRTVV